MRIRLQMLNAVPSALWTAACLTPVYLFCAHLVPPSLTACFAVCGTVAMVLPRATLARFALSRTRATYESLRVHLVIRVTQDANWLRHLARAPEPRVRRDQEALRNIIRDTWTRERFHVGLFLFCILCSTVALLQLQMAWFLALMLINTVYNVYPMWLQQYLRLRITRCQTRLPR